MPQMLLVNAQGNLSDHVQDSDKCSGYFGVTNLFTETWKILNAKKNSFKVKAVDVIELWSLKITT